MYAYPRKLRIEDLEYEEFFWSLFLIKLPPPAWIGYAAWTPLLMHRGLPPEVCLGLMGTQRFTVFDLPASSRFSL